jgi:hypothetical protein
MIQVYFILEIQLKSSSIHRGNYIHIITIKLNAFYSLYCIIISLMVSIENGQMAPVAVFIKWYFGSSSRIAHHSIGTILFHVGYLCSALFHVNKEQDTRRSHQYIYGEQQHQQQQSVDIASSTCLSYYNIHQGNRG